MVFQISQKEIEGVLKASPEKRYKNFVRDVAGWQEIWTVTPDGGAHWATTQDNEGNTYVPLWPAKEYVEHTMASNDSWKGQKAECVEVHLFIDIVKDMIKNKQFGFEIFPVKDGRGVMADANTLIIDIQEALDQVE